MNSSVIFQDLISDLSQDLYDTLGISTWMSWLFTPIMIVSLLPAVILFLLYFNSMVLYIYRLHGQRILDAYDNDKWDAGRKAVSAIWDAVGWIWHGYEVHGIENIPAGGALIVYYHGALPIDFYYFCSHILLYNGRMIRPVGDRFLFKIPGWANLLEAFGVIPGTVQSCAAILKQNDLLGIAPGGVYEAQLGDNTYELLWKHRIGYAKAAIEAQVPIIPVFTRNIRESFRSFNIGRPFWRWMYHKTHLPFVPVYGGFPVKLDSYIGQPIPFDEAHTPESLAKQVVEAMNDLIDCHQPKPGNILRGIKERFTGPLHP